MSSLSIKEIKEYMHVDYADDDGPIEMMYDAAIETMTELIPEFDPENLTARQRLLICAYVNELYDKRKAMTTQKETMRYAIRSLLMKEMY